MQIRYTPEPVILMYTFAAMLQAPVISQYVYKVFSDEKGLVYDYTKKSSTCGNLSQAQQKLQDEVQGMSALFNIGQSLCWTGATIISCIFYGALSDKVGRRTILIITCIGGVIDAAILLLVNILELPVYVFYVGAFFNGLGGSYNGLFMIGFAYLADCTEKEKLPLRIAFLEAANFVSSCVSFFTSGLFIQKYGFLPAQILMLSLNVAATLYVIIILKESLNYKNTDDHKPLSSLSEAKICEQPKILFRALIKKRPRRKYLFHSLAILVFGQCCANGLIPIVTLYFMNRPFCWPAIEVGNFLGTYLVTMAAGTIFGLKVLLKVLPEYFVAILSPMFGMGGYVLIAFAQTKAMAYGALAIRGFGGMHSPIFRATISKIVDPSEQGIVFSAETILEVFFIFVSGFIFNTTYSKLNDAHLDQVFFLIPVGLLVFQVILTLIFWIKWRKESEPLVGEYSRDNEIINEDETKNLVSDDSIEDDSAEPIA